MGFSYNVNVLNQKGSPAIYTDTFANRPAFGFAGRLFIANDTAAIYEDTGTSWVLIANVSSGAGTLQQVTTNGNTSNVGISVTAGGVSTNSATITSFTQGSVPFVGAAGLITQDNTNLFFDDTNNRLGINTNTPSNNLDVHGGGTNPLIAINNTAGNQSLIGFAKNSTAKWRIGNSSTDTFDVLNVGLTTNAISINNASNCVSFIANLLLKQSTGFQSVASFNGIACDAGGFFFQLGTSNNIAYLNFIGLTAARTFTFPNAAGTLALTSDLSSYVPYTGASTNVDLGINNITAYRSKFWDGTQGLLIGAYTGGANYGAIYPSTVTPGAANFSIAAKSGATTLNTETGGYIDLEIAGVTKMILFNTGNVAIGGIVDDTVNILQVTGRATITGIITSIGTYNNTTGIAANMQIDSNGFMARSTASSIRFKENVLNWENKGIETILKLKPVTFNYKKNYYNKADINFLGLIAEDVAEVSPYLADYENENRTGQVENVRYANIVVPLIAAIKEQQTIIDSLIKRIELLENK